MREEKCKSEFKRSGIRSKFGCHTSNQGTTKNQREWFRCELSKIMAENFLELSDYALIKINLIN